jgi:hypothetical protein
MREEFTDEERERFEERLRVAFQQPLPRARPHLTVVRDSAPPKPLPLPLPLPRARRRDSAAAGWAIAVSLLVGAVLVAAAMGWVRL